MPALPLQPDIRECADDWWTLYTNPIDCSRAVLDRAGERVREEIREEISQAASSAASNALTELAQAVNEGVHQLLKIMVAWITDVEAVDLTSGSAATTIDQMGYLLSPVVLLVGVVGLLVAAGRMVLTRKANPLIPLGGGVLVVVIVQALGVGVANLLLRAGDAWSVWVLNSTMTEQLEDRLILVMTFGQYDGSGPVSEDGATQAGLTVSALLVILLGIIVLIVTVIQMILMIFREAVIIILAALLPLAAVGMMMRATQSWLPRVSSWMLALIFYKPAVAMVYATTFVFIGGDEQPTIRTFIAGLMMLLLSLVAMQTLLSLFNWATGAVASPGGFSGVLAGIASGATGAAVGLGAQLRHQVSSTSERLGSPGTPGTAGTGSGEKAGATAPTGAKEDTAHKPKPSPSAEESPTALSPTGASGASSPTADTAAPPGSPGGATGGVPETASRAPATGSPSPAPAPSGAAATAAAATAGPPGVVAAGAAKGAETAAQAADSATRAVTDAGGLPNPPSASGATES